jgi:hypothetical protein
MTLPPGSFRDKEFLLHLCERLQKSLQDCGRRAHATLRRTAVCGVEDLGLHVPCFQPFSDPSSARCLADGVQDELMADIVECPFDISVQYPTVFTVGVEPPPALLDGVVATSAGSESIAVGFKLRFPAWFQGIFDYCLCDAILEDRYTEWPLFSIGLRYIHSPGWFYLPESVFSHLLDQLPPGFRRECHLVIYARRSLSPVFLGDASYRQQQVCMAAHHQFLQASHPIPLTSLGRSIDPLSQVPHPFVDQCPVNGPPVHGCHRSDVFRDSILHGSLVPYTPVLSSRTRWKSATFRCGAFAPLSLALPRAFAFSSILYPLDYSAVLAVGLLRSPAGESIGLTVVPGAELRSGWVLPMLRWGYVLPSCNRFPCRTTHFPFWVECVSLITLILSDEALRGSSLALTRLNFPLRAAGSRLPAANASVACIPSVSLLTPDVAGVDHPFTWEQWGRIHWEAGSLPSTLGVTSFTPSLSTSHETRIGGAFEGRHRWQAPREVSEKGCAVRPKTAIVL